MTNYRTRQRAYEAAQINPGTWAKIEDGKPVRDDTLAAVVDFFWPETGGDWLKLDLTVGAVTQDAEQYVRGPGTKAEHGEHEDATLAAIRAMRDDMRAMENRLAGQIGEVSTRVGRLEHGAEPLDGAGGEA